MKLIVGVGDRLIQGRIDDSGAGWLNRLMDALRTRGMTMQLINHGRRADTTRKLLARIQQDCIDLRPDALVLRGRDFTL